MMSITSPWPRSSVARAARNDPGAVSREARLALYRSMLKIPAPLSIIFFGDAATETSVFHESVNFAAVHRLPVLFVCENNLYSVNTPLDARQPKNRTIAELVRGHGIRTSQHDGQMVELVDVATAETIAHIRANGGPALLEFITYRWL